ncbi:hypothetical protein [Kitasatospora sp. NPDC018619]|uniref:hypothetical protein n=1 Tax=unclassified Kitasatospora TaxID=2633591 RepID=UPI0037A400D8
MTVPDSGAQLVGGHQGARLRCAGTAGTGDGTGPPPADERPTDVTGERGAP